MGCRLGVGGNDCPSVRPWEREREAKRKSFSIAISRTATAKTTSMIGNDYYFNARLILHFGQCPVSPSPRSLVLWSVMRSAATRSTLMTKRQTMSELRISSEEGEKEEVTTYSESQPVGPLIAGLCSELLVPSTSASVEWRQRCRLQNY